MGYTPADHFPELIRTMKRASAAFDREQVPCLLGGGLALWARGGPPTDHDVDFLVREADAEQALAALVRDGMSPERPPEGWLLKAYDGEVLVDLIYRPAGGPITDEHFRRAAMIEVSSQPLLVASVDDILITKLLAITEQDPDYRSVLEIARSLREQISWPLVERQTDSSPFARAFHTLVEELGLTGQNGSPKRPEARLRRAHTAA
jgi:hypothetical protein